MNKSLMALALLSATAGVAHAQSAVQIYGTVDAGFIKRSDQTLNIGRRAANTLGFKGTEDLGNGLKALFQLEMRYEPDTGTTETGLVNGVAVTRPLFQGQSRVGLAGDFGMVRIGRGVTAYQESVGAFDPWHALPTPAGFYTDLTVAGYSSQPLDAAGSSNNRWSNAVWYNSPVFAGVQVNATVATKEANNGGAYVGTGSLATPQFPGNAQASANPFSVSATYGNGPFALMLGYERNHVETKAWSIAGSVAATPELKLMATYSRQDQGDTRVLADETDAWVLGLNYRMGPGTFLAGYGQKDADNLPKVKQLSLGYEYALSKRTYVYIDASRKKNQINQNQAGLLPTALPTVSGAINHYDIGVSHSF
jgi:predicted porin